MAQPKKAPTRKAAADPDLSRRKSQSQLADTAVRITRQRAAQSKKERDKLHATLESVVDGLQSEVEKLLKKSPVDQVSDLMLEQVNQVIRDTRSLLADDDYIQRQKEFVPAGENPEIRDVSLALTQLRKGLQRFKFSGKGELEETEQAIAREAQTIAMALEMYVSSKRRQIRSDEIQAESGFSKLSQQWIDSRGLFDFERLDTINLAEYFKLES